MSPISFEDFAGAVLEELGKAQPPRTDERPVLSAAIVVSPKGDAGAIPIQAIDFYKGAV